MRYAFVLGALGALLISEAVHQAQGASGPGWAAAGVEFYVAMSLVLMATAYALRSARLPVEGLFGSRRWAILVRLLFWPYQLFALSVLRLHTWLVHEDPFNSIGPRLYLGRYLFRNEHHRLSEAGINAVIDLCAEFPGSVTEDPLPGVAKAYVPILDGCPPTDQQFRAAVDWVVRHYEQGRTVLIHCAQGHGRSAAVAAAALCRLGLAASPDEAIARLQAARPRVRPTRAQRLALARFLAPA